MEIEIGREVYRIFLNDGTTLRALVNRRYDTRRPCQETFVYGEGDSPKEEAERLYQLEDNDVVRVQYEEDDELIESEITWRNLYRLDGDFKIGKDFRPIERPKIYVCNSMEEMLGRAAGVEGDKEIA
ncbi:hypothetical protein HY450_03755 [Candidatus Pacearchaeota archaeon]|nr:hypothetical protein [Candidatus Pacearchaeota archaeon]